MGSVRVAFAGTPDFAVPALQALVSARIDVVGVLTQPDRPKGRGRQLSLTPVKTAAQSLGIETDQPRSLRAATDRGRLESWRPDVLVVVAYGLILPAEVLALPRLGCINLHASLLPRWRGAAPIQRAVLAGDRHTGVTIMQMDAGLDTGAMLRQGTVPILDTDTSGSLFTTLAKRGAELLVDVIDEAAHGKSSATPQPAEGVTYARKLDKSEAQIDWRADARAVSCRIRAFDPWPVAETGWRGEAIKLRSVVVEEEFSTGDAGRVIGVREGRLLVQCGRGTVAIKEWQRPGRRSLPADEFANGVRIVGEVMGEQAHG